MTVQEIRNELPPVAIWMADATIRQARRAICGRTGWPEIKRNPYNLPEVEMASAVLFRLFETFEAAIRYAIMAMPKDMDGVFTLPGTTYFDEFVKALDKHLKSYGTPEEVTLRQPDWILEKL